MIIAWCARPGCRKKLFEKNGNANKDKGRHEIFCKKCKSWNVIIHEGNGKIKAILKEEG
jgi:hypothetical protein